MGDHDGLPDLDHGGLGGLHPEISRGAGQSHETRLHKGAGGGRVGAAGLRGKTTPAYLTDPGCFLALHNSHVVPVGRRAKAYHHQK